MKYRKNTDTTKHCPRCQQTKLRAEFYRASRRADGLQGLCKVCTNQAKNESIQRKLDYYREMGRRHAKARRERSPEQIKTEKRRDYEKHKDRYTRSRAAWFAAHPGERERLHRLANDRRRAREVGAYVEDVHRIVVWEHDGGRCYLCGDEVSFYAMHVDHVIPISKGGLHSYENVRATHADCNQYKAARLLPNLVIGPTPPEVSQ